MPTVTLNGSVAQNYNDQGEPGFRLFNATVLGSVSVPIYTGGLVDAQVRQAKEQLSQAELQADLQRTQVRASVVSNWGLLDTAKAVIVSDQAAVKSAEIALNGVREEAKAGQRTTLDVLNAQQALVNARVCARDGAARSRRGFLCNSRVGRRIVVGSTRPRCRAL